MSELGKELHEKVVDMLLEDKAPKAWLLWQLGEEERDTEEQNNEVLKDPLGN